MIATCASASGSSPLTRGTLHGAGNRVYRCRLIPARAGNTSGKSPTGRAQSAHPRSRGEHSTSIFLVWLKPGSPPLARGTHLALLYGANAFRLTPARAGNTSARKWSISSPAAHPRSRGEHFYRRRCGCLRRGSPPLARGTQDRVRAYLAAYRLTPARAGNTVAKRSLRRWVKAHPRSRGEHSDALTPQSWRSGSPPLARGTPPPLTMHRRAVRLTPARAGNTARCFDEIPSDSAHPRSRGEHPVMAETCAA